ncbi:MAG: RNA polymerase sigma factor RpoD/SigA [Treponema sp.]|nr:RNA polymerase sigma factor RpoD/SigA [Treponema sp.]
MKKHDDVLSMYLKDINKIPLLTREEEIELSQKAKKGDKLARDKMIKANLRFVVRVAKKYQNRGLDLTDLISEGNIGLINAIEKFEPARGYHFISYAVWWINQSILKALSEKSRAIRLPLNRANELVRIEYASNLINGTLSEAEEVAQVAQMINMSESRVRELLAISNGPVSLDAKASSSESDNTVVGDYFEDQTYDRPEDATVNLALKEDVAGLLKTLRPNEEKVIRLRYGLNGYKPMSLQEIGEECNLTKERVRQIEKKAIFRLQNPSRIKKLEGYLAA